MTQNHNRSPHDSESEVHQTPDPLLVGWWKIQSIEMPVGRVLGLVGGLPGEKACFSESGHYYIHPESKGVERYRCHRVESVCELDIWIKGLEPLTSLCLYEITSDVLRIGIAGRISGGNPNLVKRPTEIRTDEKRNWAVVTMKRCKAPKSRAARQGGWNLQPGKLIPDGFLD